MRMHGRVTIAVVCTLTLAVLLVAVGMYIAATGSDAQTSPQPKSITGGAVRAPAAGGSGVGIAAGDGFIYVLDEGKVYKLKAETLEVVKSASYKPASGVSTPAKSITQPGGAGDKPK
jgi:hypothetical protein